MTDREALAREVLGSAFPTTRLKAGYREGEVDAALDELATRLRRGDDAPAVQAYVDGLRFRCLGGQRSYQVEAVDALLERVVASLEDGPGAGQGGATTLPPAAGEAFAPPPPDRAPPLQVGGAFAQDGGAFAQDGGAFAPPPQDGASLPSAVVENPPQGILARLFRRR